MMDREIVQYSNVSVYGFICYSESHPTDLLLVQVSSQMWLMLYIVFHLTAFCRYIGSPMGFVFMHSSDEWLNSLTSDES